MNSGSFYSLPEITENYNSRFLRKYSEKILKILLTSFPSKLVPLFHDLISIGNLL
jgi:hypothetical protein